jgi:hypothetical protein
MSLPIVNCLLAIACCLSLKRDRVQVLRPRPNGIGRAGAARRLLPVAHCLLPIANCLLPIANCLLPVVYMSFRQ